MGTFAPSDEPGWVNYFDGQRVLTIPESLIPRDAVGLPPPGLPSASAAPPAPTAQGSYYTAPAPSDPRTRFQVSNGVPQPPLNSGERRQLQVRASAHRTSPADQYNAEMRGWQEARDAVFRATQRAKVEAQIARDAAAMAPRPPADPRAQALANQLIFGRTDVP